MFLKQNRQVITGTKREGRDAQNPFSNQIEFIGCMRQQLVALALLWVLLVFVQPQ